jgi:histone H3/H4
MKTKQKQDSSKAGNGGKPTRSIKNISMRSRPPTLAETGIKKRRRYSTLVRASRESRRQQKLSNKGEQAIPKIVLERSVRQVAMELIQGGYFSGGIDGHKSSIAGGLRFSTKSLEAMRCITEDFGINLFKKADWFADLRGRITIHTEDLSCALEAVRPEVYEIMRSRETLRINEMKEKSSIAARMATMGLDAVPPPPANRDDGQRKQRNRR